jgi:PKD repeat protein
VHPREKLHGFQALFRWMESQASKGLPGPIRRALAKRKHWRIAGLLGVLALGLVLAQVVMAVPPTVAITASPSDGVLQIGDEVDFSATVSDEDLDQTHSFQWDFGDGTTSTDEDPPAHSYTTAGQKTVTLTVTDSGNEVGTDEYVLRVNAPPTATFAISDSVPEINQSVTFNATVTDDTGGATFAWNFGDGAIGTGQNASHPYTSAGAKTVTLTVTDSDGVSTTATQTLRVNAPPTAAFSFTPSSPNPNQPVRFTSSSADPDGSAVSHAWDFDGDGVSDGSDRVETWSFEPGTYTVGLVVTDSDGAQTAAAPQTVTVVLPPTMPQASIGFSPAAPLPGQSITFSGSASSPTNTLIATMEWDFDFDRSEGFTTDAVGASVTHAFGSAGAKSVALRVTDAGGGVAIVSETVAVNAPPTAGIAVAGSAFVGDSVTISSTSTDPDGPLVAQEWDLDNDGAFDDATGPLVSKTFSRAGVHTLLLRVTDSRGAVATTSGVVDIRTRPLAVLRDFEVDIKGSVTGRFTRVERFIVHAPAGTAVKVRCKGKGCPKAAVRRSRGRALRFKAFEKRLRAGTKVIITATKTGFIGAHRTYTMRSGKGPKKVKRCLMPGAKAATKCPS